MASPLDESLFTSTHHSQSPQSPQNPQSQNPQSSTSNSSLNNNSLDVFLSSAPSSRPTHKPPSNPAQNIQSSEFFRPFGEMIVFCTGTSIFLQPLRPRAGSYPSYILQISRKSLSFSFSRCQQPPPAELITDFVDSFGVLGFVRLVSSPFLVVITERKIVGSIRNAPVFQLTKVQFIPLIKPPLTDIEKEKEQELLQDLTQVFQQGFFFFSYDYPLTETLQRFDIMSSLPYDHLNPFKHLEKKFFYNFAMARDFTANGLYHWIVPIIYGFFRQSKWTATRTNQKLLPGYPLVFHESNKTHSPSSTNKTFSFSITLIARKSRFHAGKRYQTRGIDLAGHVANFVESEQIVQLARGPYESSASFVQIRGSIPILWGQKGKKYKPNPIIVQDQSETTKVINLHFSELNTTYPNSKFLCLNLLKQSGVEASLGQSYEYYLNRFLYKDLITKVGYKAYDFHENTKIRFSKIHQLIDALGPTLQNWKFFHVLSQGGSTVHEKSLQTGIIRSNCLDCLDRTNVVQTYIGRYILPFLVSKIAGGRTGPYSWFLSHIDVFVKNDSIVQWMKNVWADHGDVCSITYAGTPALKGEFARAGKRTAAGLMADGVNSLTRYYLNNFRDEESQIALDTILQLYFSTSAQYLIQKYQNLKPPEGFSVFGPPLRRSAQIKHLHWIPDAEEVSKPIQKVYSGEKSVGSQQQTVQTNVTLQNPQPSQSESYDNILSHQNIRAEDPLLSKVLSLEKSFQQRSQNCIAMCRDKCISDPSKEQFISGWMVISINKFRKFQLRILLLTSSAYYRVKLVKKKNEYLPVHSHKIPLISLSAIQYGPLVQSKSKLANPDPNSPFGFRIYSNGYGQIHENSTATASESGWNRWPSLVDKQPFRTFKLLAPVLTLNQVRTLRKAHPTLDANGIRDIWHSNWGKNPEFQQTAIESIVQVFQFAVKKCGESLPSKVLDPLKIIKSPIFLQGKGLGVVSDLNNKINGLEP